MEETEFLIEDYFCCGNCALLMQDDDEKYYCGNDAVFSDNLDVIKKRTPIYDVTGLCENYDFDTYTKKERMNGF